jgi:hypothetical protein
VLVEAMVMLLRVSSDSLSKIRKYFFVKVPAWILWSGSQLIVGG